MHLAEVFRRQGQWEAAFEAARRGWEQMLQGQKPGQRFHKGRELANMGVYRLDAGMHREGFRWLLIAFIEDALKPGRRLSNTHGRAAMAGGAVATQVRTE